MSEQGSAENKEVFIPKEISEAFGLGEQSTIEDFKKTMDENWVKRDNIFKDEKIKSDVYGRVYGATSNELKKRARDLAGIELKKEDLANNKLEDLFEITINGIKDKYEAQINELKLTSSDSSEASKVFEERIEKLKSELKDKDSLLETSRSEWENRYKQIENDIYVRDKSAYRKSLFESLKFSNEVDPLKVEGFKSMIDRDIEIIKDSEGNWDVVNKEGSRIKNPNVIGDYYKPTDYIKDKAIELGLISINPKSKPNPEYKKAEQTTATTKPTNVGGMPVFTKPFGLR